MEVVQIEKHFEEEIVVGSDYRVIKIRNVVIANLNKEEVIKESSDRLYELAKKMTRRDIDKTIEQYFSEKGDS